MGNDEKLGMPFSERVVTDYGKLAPEYLEYLHQKADEARDRQKKSEAAESSRTP